MSVEDTGDILNHVVLRVAFLEREVAATELDRCILVVLDALVDTVPSRRAIESQLVHHNGIELRIVSNKSLQAALNILLLPREKLVSTDGQWLGRPELQDNKDLLLSGWPREDTVEVGCLARTLGVGKSITSVLQLELSLFELGLSVLKLFLCRREAIVRIHEVQLCVPELERDSCQLLAQCLQSRLLRLVYERVKER